MSNTRILVTGGAGYIGSHACKALHAAGLSPVAYDDLSNGHEQAVQWGPLVRGDVRDATALAATMRAYRISGVVHFAGLIEVGRSVSEPDLFWDHNLNGVAAVLSAMRDTGVRRLVFSSTAAVYGSPGDSGSLWEGCQTRPINPYGDSKLAGERMIAASCAAYGLQGFALRYFNAAGADPDGRIGEAHHPETHLIPLAIEAALGCGRPLTVFGDDFDTPDGTCVRDYVHVSDLARAHVLALTTPAAPGSFEAINLGGGEGRSVREVLAAVDAACGRPTPYAVGPRRPGDPPVLVADARLARARLGWRPERSGLAEILADAVAWRQGPGFSDRSAAAA